MPLSLAHAEALVGRGRAAAASLGVRAVFSVLDAGAHPVLFVRMDGAWLGSSELAVGKARASVMFEAPSGALAAPLELGKVALHFDHVAGGLVLIAGGLPLRDPDGVLIGAVGVSGGSVVQDGEIADACVSPA